LTGVETHQRGILAVVEVGSKVDCELGLSPLGVEIFDLLGRDLKVVFASAELFGVFVLLVVLGSELHEFRVVGLVLGLVVGLVLGLGGDDGAEKSEGEDLFHLLRLLRNY